MVEKNMQATLNSIASDGSIVSKLARYIDVLQSLKNIADAAQYQQDYHKVFVAEYAHFLFWKAFHDTTSFWKYWDTDTVQWFIDQQIDIIAASTGTIENTSKDYWVFGWIFHSLDQPDDYWNSEYYTDTIAASSFFGDLWYNQSNSSTPEVSLAADALARGDMIAYSNYCKTLVWGAISVAPFQYPGTALDSTPFKQKWYSLINWPSLWNIVQGYTFTAPSLWIDSKTKIISSINKALWQWWYVSVGSYGTVDYIGDVLGNGILTSDEWQLNKWLNDSNWKGVVCETPADLFPQQITQTSTNGDLTLSIKTPTPRCVDQFGNGGINLNPILDSRKNPWTEKTSDVLPYVTVSDPSLQKNIKFYTTSNFDAPISNLIYNGAVDTMLYVRVEDSNDSRRFVTGQIPIKINSLPNLDDSNLEDIGGWKKQYFEVDSSSDDPEIDLDGYIMPSGWQYYFTDGNGRDVPISNTRLDLDDLGIGTNSIKYKLKDPATGCESTLQFTLFLRDSQLGDDSYNYNGYSQRMFALKQNDPQNMNAYIYNTLYNRFSIVENYDTNLINDINIAYTNSDYAAQTSFCNSFITQAGGAPDERPMIFIPFGTTIADFALQLVGQEKKYLDIDGSIRQPEIQYQWKWYDIYGCMPVAQYPVDIYASNSDNNQNSSAGLAVQPISIAVDQASNQLYMKGKNWWVAMDYGDAYYHAEMYGIEDFDASLQASINDKGWAGLDTYSPCPLLYKDYMRLQLVAWGTDWNTMDSIYTDINSLRYKISGWRNQNPDRTNERLGVVSSLSKDANDLQSLQQLNSNFDGSIYTCSPFLYNRNTDDFRDINETIPFSASQSASPTVVYPITNMVLAGNSKYFPNTIFVQSHSQWSDFNEKSDGAYLLENTVGWGNNLSESNDLCHRVFDSYISENSSAFSAYIPDSIEQKGLWSRFLSWIKWESIGSSIQFILVPTNRSDSVTNQFFKSKGIPTPSPMYQCIPTYPLEDERVQVSDQPSSLTLGNHDIYLSDVQYLWVDQLGNPNYANKYNSNTIPINTPFVISFMVKNKWPKGWNIDGLDFSLGKEWFAWKKSLLQPLNQRVVCSDMNGATTTGTLYLAWTSSSCTVTVSYVAKQSGIYNFTALSKTNVDEKRTESDTTNNSLAVRFIVTKDRVNGVLKNNTIGSDNQ